MRVKVLRKHHNQFGDTYTKRPGDHYEHPRPEADISHGHVEPAVEQDESSSPAGPASKVAAKAPAKPKVSTKPKAAAKPSTKQKAAAKPEVSTAAE